MTEQEFEAEVMAGPIVDNASTRLYAIGELEAESIFEPCEECDGDGGWTETYEASDGRDVDVDTLCNKCGGSGLQ